jgi:effector-binding domain-containing protein
MYEITERVLAERPTAVVRRRLEAPEIADWIGPALADVVRALARAGNHPAGPPFARYLKVEGTAACFDVEAGFPVAEPMASHPDEPVRASRLPGGPAAVTVHEGPYEAMTPAYEALDKWIAEQGGNPDGPPWETYLSEPTSDPATWRTEVVQPFQIG